MTDIKIRAAEEKDIPICAEITKNDGFQYPRVLEASYMLSQFKAGERFFVAEVGGKLVGYISIKELAMQMEIHLFSVLKEFHGKGIGSALLGEMEKLAKKEGRKKMFLYVNQKNFDALAFYARKKFYVNGVFLNKYGEGLHSVLMAKDL